MIQDRTTSDPRANLIILRDYLLTLPADYAQFEMETFLEAEEHDSNVINYLKQNGSVASCGTAACAVGHGPAAHMFFLDSEIDVDPETGFIWAKWSEYTRRLFGVDRYSDDFDWMFGGIWTDVDNTVHGAANRITTYLESGVPEGFRDVKYFSRSLSEFYA